MAVWFPTLRATLAARLGPYMPPHPLRTVSGAALSALLAWILASGIYFICVAVYNLGTGATSIVTSVGDMASGVLNSVSRKATQNATIVAGQTNATLAASVNATTGVPAGVPRKDLPYPPVRGVPTVRTEIAPFELPYVEGPTMAFQDTAKQVDYALTQTLLRLGMDFSRLEVIQTEPRIYQNPTPLPLSSPDSGKPRRPEPYQFQRLRVHLPGAVADFISMLDSNLTTWAEHAVMEQTKRQGRTLLLVKVDGTPTHEIFLQPAGSMFVPEPVYGDPRMTVVIDDMGADLSALRTLLHLDIPVTISIIPSTAHAVKTAAEAAAAGQEVLLHQPMEPMQAPYIKPGPGALLLSMTPDAQRETLRKNIVKLPQAVGMNNHMGSRATKDRDLSRLAAEEASAAGMFVLDSVTIPESILFEEAQNASVTSYKRNFFLDDGSPTKRAILNTLRQAEQYALRTGHAIVIGHPRPNTLAALQQWVHERDSVVSLVPLRYQYKIND